MSTANHSVVTAVAVAPGLLSASAAPLRLQPPAAPADLVLRGGPIITLDSMDRVAQALAVRGNRILAVGSRIEIDRLVGPATRVIELQGRRVVPGFIDAHAHVESTAQFRHFWVDLHKSPGRLCRLRDGTVLRLSRSYRDRLIRRVP